MRFRALLLAAATVVTGRWHAQSAISRGGSKSIDPGRRGKIEQPVRWPWLTARA